MQVVVDLPRLDDPVFRRLSGSDEVERDATTVGAFIERARRELGAVIDGDRPRRAVQLQPQMQKLIERTSLVLRELVPVYEASAAIQG
jgi:hypothetical protein